MLEYTSFSCLAAAEVAATNVTKLGKSSTTPTRTDLESESSHLMEKMTFFCYQ